MIPKKSNHERKEKSNTFKFQIEFHSGDDDDDNADDGDRNYEQC